jgi:hypothetical protein
MLKSPSSLIDMKSVIVGCSIGYMIWFSFPVSSTSVALMPRMLPVDGQLNEEGDRCASLSYICEEDEHRNEDYCVRYGKENPEWKACSSREET